MVEGVAMGAAWLVGLVLFRYETAWRTRPITRIALLAIVMFILAGHAYGTHQRNQIWSSSESLWLDVTRKSPNNGRGQVQYLFLGLCPAAPAALLPPIACTNAPCYIGVHLPGAATVSTGFAPVRVPVPQTPALVGLVLCLQCADAVLAQPCMALSAAATFAIQA